MKNAKAKRMNEIFQILDSDKPLLGQDVKLEEGKIFKHELTGYVGSIMKPNSIEDEHVVHVLGNTPKEVQKRMQRIINAVNMHDELLSALNNFVSGVLNGKKFSAEGPATIKAIQILKQSEQE